MSRISHCLVLLMAYAALMAVSGLDALAAPNNPAPFVWEVSGGGTTHYLMGSVHVLPRAAQDLPEGITQAYEAASQLTFETDIGSLREPAARWVCWRPQRHHRA